MTFLSDWNCIIGRYAFSLVVCLLTSQTATAQNRDVAEQCISSHTQPAPRVLDGAEPGLYLVSITMSSDVALEQSADASEIERLLAQCQMNLTKLIAHDIAASCDQSGEKAVCFSRKRYVAESTFTSPNSVHEASPFHHGLIVNWIRYRVAAATLAKEDLAVTVSANPQLSDHMQVEIVGFSHIACLLTAGAFDGSNNLGYIFNGKNVVEIRSVSQLSENNSLIGSLKHRHTSPAQLCKFVVDLTLKDQG